MNFTKALFAVALEYSLLELNVVESCSKLRKAVEPKKWPEESNALVERNKQDKDRKIVYEVLLGSLLELLSPDPKWNHLNQAIQDLTQDSIALEAAIIDHEYLQKTYEVMIKELKTNKKETKRALHKADAQITELKDRTQDEIKNAKMRLQYAEKWMNAKAELIDIQADSPRKPVPTREQALRVHEEILKIYDLHTKEKEKSLDFWRVKYAGDTCEINKKVAQKRDEFRVIVKRRQALEDKFNSHAAEINSWLAIKRERAEKKAEEERIRRAATSIQAWWRGEMVRRAIGSFKHLQGSKKPTQKTKRK